MTLRVDNDRLKADFDTLGGIGWTERGGLERTTFSESHLAARAWFLERAKAAGLEPRVDSAANHSALLPAPEPDARTLLLGSHLDSVSAGGRYDGALGVVCALEVLRSVKDAGLELPVTLEAIDFTDEEGTPLGTLGSRALTGALTAEILAAPRGGRDHLLAELERTGLSEDGLLAAGRERSTLAGYLELHVEQGPVLEYHDANIGVVTAIRGHASFDVTFIGQARHAGTTPMDLRRDAALGAASLVLAVRDTVMRRFPGCVANVGDIHLQPGAYNVVPGRAHVRLECRSLDDEELERLADALREQARSIAEEWNLHVEVAPVGRWTPSTTDPTVREAFTRAAETLGLTSIELASGAGHDAQILAQVTRSGMVFVPSDGGISHDPAEHTCWSDCLNGANVLLGAAVDLARSL